MAEQLQVVFLDHTTQFGGAELALSRLLKTNQNWIASLITPEAADEDAFDDLPNAVNHIRTGRPGVAISSNPNKSAALLQTAGQVIGVALSATRSRAVKDCHVIVANTTRASVYGVAIGLLRRKKSVVVHVRDIIEPEAIGNLATTLMRNFVLPRVTGIIANSRASLASVRPYLNGDAQSAVITSPAGLGIKGPDEVVPGREVRRIGMVARIDPWKGQSLLIRAFARAFPEGEVRLVFAGLSAFGHAAYLEELEQLARELGVRERVEFVGHVSDIANFIESLDVCVQCSVRPEPLGQNVLQYLSAGKPTIVSGEGGPSEWVVDGENGLHFTPRHEAGLAEKLLLVQRDKALRDKLHHGAIATQGLESDQQVGTRIRNFLADVVGV